MPCASRYEAATASRTWILERAWQQVASGRERIVWIHFRFLAFIDAGTGAHDEKSRLRVTMGYRARQATPFKLSRCHTNTAAFFLEPQRSAALGLPPNQSILWKNNSLFVLRRNHRAILAPGYAYLV
jgi:hypothetical protein